MLKLKINRLRKKLIKFQKREINNNSDKIQRNNFYFKNIYLFNRLIIEYFNFENRIKANQSNSINETLVDKNFIYRLNKNYHRSNIRIFHQSMY